MLAPGQNEVNKLYLGFNQISTLSSEVFLLSTLTLLHCLPPFRTHPCSCLTHCALQ